MSVIKQGTQAWHDQRKNRITGTRIPRAVKECAWAKGDQWEALGRDMYREAHNLTQDPFDQRALYAITYGKDHEPIALDKLKDMGYKITQPSFVVHPEHDWLGMSPDGVLIKGRKGNISAVEIKCPQTKPVQNVKEQKRNYWHQMQLGMECMDIDEMLFFQWYEDAHFQEWVERDPNWAKTYIPKAREFMDWYAEKSKDPTYVARWSEDKEEPGINYKSISEDDYTTELASVLKELNELKDRSAYLDTRKKDLSAVLVKKYGGAFSTPKVKCHMTQARGRINYARLVKDQNIPFEVMEGYRSEGDTRIYTKLLEE
jgi:putative phage-type endonuclease